MLQKLSIKNYALIDDVKLELDKGFTAITGETGAGKSILLGAIGLLLGKRADLSAIKNQDKKCIIEGEFWIKDYHLKSIFDEEELDYDAHSIIRREILPSGKSRLFINDTPVRLTQAQRIGSHLVDIHSQHDTLSITQSNYQYKLLDNLANSAVELTTYRQTLSQLKAAKQELQELRLAQQQAQNDYDYNLFLFEELDNLKLESVDQEALELEKNRLDNVEVLQEKLTLAFQQLSNEDLGITAQLRQLQLELKKAAQVDEQLEGLFDRVNSSLIELEDIQIEIESESNSIENNPARKAEVDQILNELYRLQTKHQVDSILALIDIRDQLYEQIQATQNADQNLAEVEQQIETLQNTLNAHAQTLYAKRASILEVIKKAIEGTLAVIGMPEAKFEIKAALTQDFKDHGAGEFRWLFSANKGHELLALDKVASGGELSRITLALKALLSRKIKLPTLILDEIDTGVSGEIASKMAEVMLNMGTKMQLIAITHLPQIASRAESHVKVYKAHQANKTTSQLAKLSTEERILELAEMLGGKTSKSALSHAKSLLNQ